jgi:hypothetical protein
MNITAEDALRGYVAIKYGSGPFHPGIASRDGSHSVLYWPNVNFATEEEAIEYAKRALLDAYYDAGRHMSNWNIYSV